MDSTEVSPTVSANSKAQRKSRWASSWLAIKFIASVFKDNGLRLRGSDAVSSISLVVAAVVFTVIALVPGIGGPAAILCDLIAGTAIVFYIANRLGAVTMFTPRQVLLICELILGFCVLSVYLFLNGQMILEIVRTALISTIR